ncbi:MAG: SUMF1/EgtB/PvdO family nonheme iron enzyme, partial [Myxococcota bacterium]
RLDDDALAQVAPLVELGLAHEEQHQELILTDILHAFSESPLRPAWRPEPRTRARSAAAAPAMEWRIYDGGPVWIGVETPGLVFDHEGPRHRAWLEPYALATRPVSVGEVKAFARDGGYRDHRLWASDGIDFVRARGIAAPGYVTVDGDTWVGFGLDGPRELDDDEPVAHLSWYEADAIARWMDARLPTEAEWENAAREMPVEGNFRDTGWLRPLPGARMYGDVWQWTASPYTPYPGYRPAPGAIGEYNGKFMANQVVLRGGSCLTPPGHVRATYRNFWPPDTRFQVSGLRLARDRR